MNLRVLDYKLQTRNEVGSGLDFNIIGERAYLCYTHHGFETKIRRY